MAKLALVYGMKLLPLDDLESVEEARVRLKEGREAQVPMRLMAGSIEEIREQFNASVSAFFDFYPEL